MYMHMHVVVRQTGRRSECGCVPTAVHVTVVEERSSRLELHGVDEGRDVDNHPLASY